MTHLLSDLTAGILRLTLNDPATRNSLSEAMMTSLQSALDGAASDGAVRVVVIDAAGPAFCSGHNLKEITARRADADKGAAYFAKLFGDCARLMSTIVRLPKPVIAEVQGPASAAGCQLLASCDLAYAAETASFCTPGVNIGLFCSTPMVALSRNVAPKHAMEMLLTGEIISADEAVRIGLVNRAVPLNELGAATTAVAAKIASKSMATVKTGKEAFYRQLDMPLDEAYAYTARVMTENLLKRDAEEGIAAFIGKRDPQWDEQVMQPRVSLVTLGVLDMPRQRAFYERLGFKTSSASNPHVTFFEANGVVLGLFGYGALAEDAHMKAGEPAAFRGVSLAWNVASEAEADAVMAHAETCGARILKPAQKVFWGGYSGYFADPEGHLWEVAFNPFFPLDAAGHIQIP